MYFILDLSTLCHLSLYNQIIGEVLCLSLFDRPKNCSIFYFSLYSLHCTLFCAISNQNIVSTSSSYLPDFGNTYFHLFPWVTEAFTVGYAACQQMFPAFKFFCFLLNSVNILFRKRKWGRETHRLWVGSLKTEFQERKMPFLFYTNFNKDEHVSILWLHLKNVSKTGQNKLFFSLFLVRLRSSRLSDTI